MAAKFNQHTVESLLANTVEEADCRLWLGYSAKGRHPMVYGPDRKMVSVRALIASLQGRKETGGFWSYSCDNPRCVEPAHFVHRDLMAHMNECLKKSTSYEAIEAIRRAKISKARRANSVITDEVIAEILRSKESGAEIARRLGVSKTTVCKYRRGESGITANPFRGLLIGK